MEGIKLLTAYNYMQYRGLLSDISVEKYILTKKLLKDLSINSLLQEVKRLLFSFYSVNEAEAFDICESVKEFILNGFTIQEIEELQCL